jgi:hypothetical protein
MVGKKFDYLKQLLLENRGLGILYHSFAGALEDKNEVRKELDRFLQDGYVNFVKFKLNAGQCQRIVSYLEEYRSKDVGRYYGLANRPLFAEGAGCSAFGASFLEVAGIMEQEILEAWSHTILIPLDYAGPPLRDEGVNLIRLMLGAHSWAKADEPHKKLFFWEPDRMYQWVNKKIQMKDKQPVEIIEMARSKGIGFDRSEWPVPEGPIWKQHTDPQYQVKK